MIKRKISKRFKFDYEYYNADRLNQRMLHIKIYGAGLCPIQTDLWLDEKDQQKIKEILESEK